jgi:hypothetical protein
VHTHFKILLLSSGKKAKAGGMAQMVECPPSKRKAEFKPSTASKKKIPLERKPIDNLTDRNTQLVENPVMLPNNDVTGS